MMSDRIPRVRDALAGNGFNLTKYTFTPRPVIVKFISYEPRRAIFTAKRKLKGSKFVITENLTRRRMDLLRKVRASANVEASWTSDGRIVCLLSTGRKVTVTNESHIKGLI